MFNTSPMIPLVEYDLVDLLRIDAPPREKHVIRSSIENLTRDFSRFPHLNSVFVFCH